MRHEKTGKRSLAFSLWHREALADDCCYLDLDCVEFCDYCTLPLAVIEITSVTKSSCLNQAANKKPARYTRYIAEKLSIPAYVLSYVRNEQETFEGPVSLLEITPKRVFRLNENEPEKLADFIDNLHDCKYCQSKEMGRFLKLKNGGFNE